MKGEVVTPEVLPYLMGALEILVKANFSQEVMKFLSLFLTFAFHLPASATSRTPKPASNNSRSSTPGPTRRPTIDISRPDSPMAALRGLTKKQLGIRVLTMYSNLLCSKDNIDIIKKFARTVTNKAGILPRYLFEPHS
jgi:hypothetical protein